MKAAKIANPLGLRGIEFVEFSGPAPRQLDHLFAAFGFSRLMRHERKAIDYYVQNDIHFLLNIESGSHAARFQEQHGPSISAMGWRVEDADLAFETAVARGAKAAAHGDYRRDGEWIPAIIGIGGSLIYFIADSSNAETRYQRMGFRRLPVPDVRPSKGFLSIDHLTNNVPKGEMAKWADFYKNVFGFTEVRYFDIRGAKTGLTSYALRSPCGLFCIPINEGTEAKSQINEYLEEYRGPGVQHLAFITNDIISSVDALAGSVQTLDIDDQYYEEVFQRVPNVTEDHAKLRDHHILIDGDEEGYLLQIFTKNVVGPIFIEIIQRKNHQAFGEGNFGALFRSIERDQERRGYL